MTASNVKGIAGQSSQLQRSSGGGVVSSQQLQQQQQQHNAAATGNIQLVGTIQRQQRATMPITASSIGTTKQQIQQQLQSNRMAQQQQHQQQQHRQLSNTSNMKVITPITGKTNEKKNATSKI